MTVKHKEKQTKNKQIMEQFAMLCMTYRILKYRKQIIGQVLSYQSKLHPIKTKIKDTKLKISINQVINPLFSLVFVMIKNLLKALIPKGKLFKVRAKTCFFARYRERTQALGYFISCTPSHMNEKTFGINNLEKVS